MPTLTLNLSPGSLAVGLLGEPQVCYVLLTIGAAGDGGTRPVNWALVADASRSMRIPIVDEHQFRALVREGGAQETLVDGVPVWQLTGPVPPEVRAASSSALDHVARALHSFVERLDGQDRFALVACAEEAVLLTRSTSGAERVELVRGISRLKSLNLGEQTDLAHGLTLALNELRRGRDGARVERLLLLTDGFTQRPEACVQLASAAGADGVAISTVGLGGEFQEEVLTALADRSGGRAIFLHKPEEIPRAIAAELAATRAAAVRAATLRVTPAAGVTTRRITRIRPSLAMLYEQIAPDALSPSQAAAHDPRASLPLGDLKAGVPVLVLLELLIPAQLAGLSPLAWLAIDSDGVTIAEIAIPATYQPGKATPPPDVLDAAARASAARLQHRALEAAGRGAPGEAARLLRNAAARLDDLGERILADIARDQAAAIERTGQANALATKELTYATRRLGGDEV